MKTIVILGPESTGKTTLANLLSRYFKGVLIPEYARSYVEQLDRGYTYDDVEHIARHQIAEFKKVKAECEGKVEYLFLDTFLIVTKVWFQQVYNRCPPWFNLNLELTGVDLFVLCKPDIPWVDDPVRENPHLREHLYECYKKELNALSLPYIEIGGDGKIRAKRAVRGIRAYFRKHKK